MNHYSIRGSDPIDVTEDLGEEFNPTRPYGVGIDTHSKFIYVTILTQTDSRIIKFDRAFEVGWSDLLAAREWIISILNSKPNPPLGADEIETFSYTIESTSVYHLPVLRALRGKPCVINPLLASPARRKTDALDSKLLAYQNLTGLWPVSYVVNDDFNTLRIMLAQRETARKEAAKLSNQINNYLLRFGHTVGRAGSVTATAKVRGVVEDLIAGNTEYNPLDTCPDELPQDVKQVLSDMYVRYKNGRELQAKYENDAYEFAKGILLEPDENGEVHYGREILEALQSVPGVGRVLGVYWLSIVCNINRFPNSKACAAFCGLDPSLKVSAGKVTSTVKRGGNKQLHALLTNAASMLIRNRVEKFGKWGYQRYTDSGSWRKACSAVARKIAVAMYWVHKKCEPFSYEGYKIMTEFKVTNIDMDTLYKIEPAFYRYRNTIALLGVSNTDQLVMMYNNNQLKQVKGLGKKFFDLLHGYIYNNGKYDKLLVENELISLDELAELRKRKAQRVGDMDGN